jgi:hypothetical protein
MGLPPQVGSAGQVPTMSVGWGGAPLQQQQHPAKGPPQRFRQHHEDGSYPGGPPQHGPVAGFQRGRTIGSQRGTRGSGISHLQGGPMAHHQRQVARQNSGDPRQKNQGYRRLWQQVTQASCGGLQVVALRARLQGCMCMPAHGSNRSDGTMDAIGMLRPLRPHASCRLPLPATTPNTFCQKPV